MHILDARTTVVLKFDKNERLRSFFQMFALRFDIYFFFLEMLFRIKAQVCILWSQFVHIIFDLTMKFSLLLMSENLLNIILNLQKNLNYFNCFYKF